MKAINEGTLFVTDICYDWLVNLKVAGVSFSRLSTDGFGCVNCGGIGVIGFLAEHHTEAARTIFTGGQHVHGEVRTFPCPVCSDDTASRMAALWADSGLDQSEVAWSVDFIEGMEGKEAALKAARDLLAMTPKPDGWLTVYGAYGVGKSGLLKSLVTGFIRAGVQARYVLAADVLNDIYNAMGKGAEDRLSDVLHRYDSYHVLAIDEIGLNRIPDTEFAQAQLMRVFNRRYDARAWRATIFATNDDPARMIESLGYLADRMGHGKRVLMSGENLRRGGQP